jgi:hypothetical protein
MARHNRAAFSRADVEDAKRGYPDFDLRDYAAVRGLEFLDHGTPAGFRAAVPGAEELQSNVLRGVLPGGEYGVIAHEGLEIGTLGDGFDWDGTFYGVRVIAKGDFGGILGFVPVVNWFVGSDATARVRLPCTVAAVRVPETAGTLTNLRFDRRRSSTPFSFRERIRLAEFVGEKGWDLYAGEKPEPEVVARLAAEPVAGLLRAHTGDGLFQAVVWWGTLVVRRNGFLRSAEELDELARAASLLARRLREVCLPLAEPQRFDTALPSPPPPYHRGFEAPPGFFVEEQWSGWGKATGDRYRLVSEDPLAYHRAFPSLPVPGIACIALRGTVPRLGVPGRLVVHREPESARPAVVISAPPGSEATPPGGRARREHGVRVEIADGLLAVWSIDSYWGAAMAGDLDAFCATVATVLEPGATTDEASDEPGPYT